MTQIRAILDIADEELEVYYHLLVNSFLNFVRLDCKDSFLHLCRNIYLICWLVECGRDACRTNFYRR